MTEMPREERPAAPAASRWVKVWDLPTRLFHWLLVSLVVVGVVTGFVTPEWWMGVHIWAGYGLLALMAFRLVWGLCGPEYSRVVSFLYPPRSTVEHLRGLVLLRPPHYVGHNPTGALMVFALTGVLIAIVATGLLVLGGEEKQGPLLAVIGYAVGSAAKQVHRWLVLLLLALVAGHVAGVVTESLLTHDNLVRAMITGWKRLPPEAPGSTPRPARCSPSRCSRSWRVARPGPSSGCRGYRRPTACARSPRTPRISRNAGRVTMPSIPACSLPRRGQP
jgi:cytochrome b